MSSFAYGFEVLCKVGARRVMWFGDDLWISFPRIKTKSGVMRGDTSGGMSMVIVREFC